jgi:hypothetical protein
LLVSSSDLHGKIIKKNEKNGEKCFLQHRSSTEIFLWGMEFHGEGDLRWGILHEDRMFAKN